MYYKNVTYLVAGLQKSGFSSAEFLLKKNAKVYIYDMRKTKNVISNKEKLVKKGAINLEYYDNAPELCDVLVISPGVPIDSEICKIFKRANKRVIGETELAFLNVTTPIIAVSGTNGKTTVCNMIHSALKNNNVESELLGNVGTPLISKTDEVNKKDACVLEVSSFQLETTYLFCPHISVVLNITPDHLDRHYTFENYLLVKSKMVISLRESEFAVLNYDDDNVRNLASLTKAQIVWFSTKTKVSGAYVLDDKIYFNDEFVMKVSELSLKETHNIENALACVCVLKSLNVENDGIVNSLKSFEGLSHRFKTVATINGVTFINDSKSTNQASAIKAIENLCKPTVLILGGEDKGLDYTNLFSCIKNSKCVKQTVITGNVSKVMAEYAVKNEVDNVTIVKGFENAVKTAYRLAFSGDNVLLTPATSSFDEFNGFEERGEKFAQIVESFK